MGNDIIQSAAAAAERYSVAHESDGLAVLVYPGIYHRLGYLRFARHYTRFVFFFSGFGTVSWTACDCIIIIQYTATAIYLMRRGRADEFFSTFSNFFRCWQVELARGEEVIILFRRGRKKNGFSKARANVTCREPKNIWRRSNGSTCAGGGWLHTYIIIYGTHVHTYPPNSEH